MRLGKQYQSGFKKTAVLIAGLLFLFAAPALPSNSAAKTDIDGPLIPKVTYPMASHFEKQYTVDLPDLLKRRYIRVLTTFNKTNYFMAGSHIYGYEYSLLKDYEKYLNKQIRRRDLKVVLEFIPVSRDRLIPALVNGYGDIAAAGLTITPGRLREVDFTRPYLTGINEVIVTHKSVSDLKSLDDLSGRRVFVRRSSSYYESLLNLNKGFIKKGLEPIRIIKADETLETEDILEIVNSGAVKITVADSHIAGIWSGIFGDLQAHENLKVRTGGKIAWMVRKNNPELKADLNRFIKTRRKGTLYGNIYFNRYFKNEKFIKNPVTPDERKKQLRYRKLFQKYANQYGLDWLLVMALAYQESGLDNNRKNPSGAIGIMQIKPSTASDKKIGIRNIELADNNIHAGVKYLAFLKKRYFNDADMREKDRVRFSLAAYNAGPAKIRRAINRAKKMGLDPKRWFRNVEYAALKIIGQETVGYVSNINKYYITLKLVSENEKMRDLNKERIIRK